MDTFGRKKTIVIKALGLIVILIVLIVLGFVGKAAKHAAPAIYFITIFFATFTFDLQIHGFESIIREKRENFIVSQSAVRILGICIVCISFYFLNHWVYFFCIEAGLTFVLLVLFMKFAFESPHFIMTSTASLDTLKFILNRMAIINEEDILTDKIALS